MKKLTSNREVAGPWTPLSTPRPQPERLNPRHEDVKLSKASSGFRQWRHRDGYTQTAGNPASQTADVPVPVQMQLRLLHHQSRQSHASQHHTRANKQHATDQTKPLRQQDCTTGLKTIVHSVPRCSHFYRHFPALCLLIRSNPPNTILRHTTAAQCYYTATTGWALTQDERKREIETTKLEYLMRNSPFLHRRDKFPSVTIDSSERAS